MKRIAYALLMALGLTSAVKAEDVAVVAPSEDVIASQALKKIEELNLASEDKAEATSWLQNHKALVITTGAAVAAFGTWVLFATLTSGSKFASNHPIVDKVNFPLVWAGSKAKAGAKAGAGYAVKAAHATKDFFYAAAVDAKPAVPGKRAAAGRPAVKRIAEVPAQPGHIRLGNALWTTGGLVAVLLVADVLRDADHSLIKKLIKKMHKTEEATTEVATVA